MTSKGHRKLLLRKTINKKIGGPMQERRTDVILDGLTVDVNLEK
jgi:hypothetical protein